MLSKLVSWRTFCTQKTHSKLVEILSTQHHWQGAMGLVMEGLLELGKGYLLVLLLPSFTHPIGFIVLLCLKREKK